MRWSPEEPQIGEMDGFAKTDIFGYAKCGTWLADLLAASEDDPIVLVDGDWGSGKTVFALQWAGLLRQRGNAVLHFDAFASDYQDDSFRALAEAVHGFTEERALGEPVRRAFSGAAARAGALAFAKGLGRQVVPGLDVTAVVEEVSEGIKGETSRLRTWIEEARVRKEAMEVFQGALEQVARASVQEAAERSQDGDASSGNAEDGPEAEDSSNRLFVIVDELDRCKPTFALSLLERIKHAFGVPGVCFVLVANLSELRQSVEKAYGGVDGRKYLEKFYDLRFRLPVGGRQSRFRSKTEVYAGALWHQLTPEGIRGNRADMKTFHCLADSEEMSLRTMEHAMRNILVLATLGEGDFLGYPPAGVLASVIRVARPELFRRILRGEAQESHEDIVAMKEAALGPSRRGLVHSGSAPKRDEDIRENWRLKQAAELLDSFDF